MSEKEKKELNDGFTIQINLTNDSSEIPGIAELLGKKTSTKTSSLRELKDSHDEDAPKAALKSSSLKSLREFEVKMEIHFELKKESYHFLQSNLTGSDNFMGMDDLLKGMKIPVQFTTNPFEESNKNENQFWFEVLGVEEQSWIQMIKSQNSKLLTIFISSKSMSKRIKDVIEYCEANYSSVLSGGSIELEIA